MSRVEAEAGRLAVAVVGCGYWGPNYVRNFHENPDSHVVAVVDTRDDRLAAIGRRYPDLRLTRDVADVFADDDIEAVAIATYLFRDEPLAVHAVGASHSPSGQEDVAYVTLSYPDNLIAHCHVNWLSPVKIRQTLVAGSEKMLVWNDLVADERIKVYDHGV